MKKFLAIFFSIMLFKAYPCTTILVTKGASADGSVFVAHSDDDELSDQRIIYVPAADHKKGAKRAVYYDPCSMGANKDFAPYWNYRYIGADRGPGYINNELIQSKPLGFIDQVEHTYAYFDGNYGIMNEHQLMIGECTCGAKVEPKPEAGKRIFYSAELSRVALERCKTARDAIKLMGELMEKYGYYGTGETLLVADKEEGWVMEMCGYDANGAEGIWVAQKVTDGEIFAAANEFRIREVKKDSSDFMYSKNLFSVTEKLGWYDPKKGELDWLKTVSNGEYNHPYYSLRRVWSIFNRLSPKSKFSPRVKDGFTREYPFSIKPEKKLNVSDVFALYRDHYEGTEFDLTKGIAAGAFGSPNRFIGKYDGNQNDVTKEKKMFGAWERPISVFYAGYTYVAQARSWMPDAIGGVAWFGPDKASETCFVPFFIGTKELPRAYQICNTSKFDKSSAWWAFNFVANWAELKYSYMIEDIKAKQKELEEKEFDEIRAVENKALALYKSDPKKAISLITDYTKKNAERIVSEWWKLSEFLIVKYNDGFINDDKGMAQTPGYSREWLDKTGYGKGPIKYKK